MSWGKDTTLYVDVFLWIGAILSFGAASLVLSLLVFHVYLLFVGIGTYDWLVRRARLQRKRNREKAERARAKREEEMESGTGGVELSTMSGPTKKVKSNQTLPVDDARETSTSMKTENRERSENDRKMVDDDGDDDSKGSTMSTSSPPDENAVRPPVIGSGAGE